MKSPRPSTEELSREVRHGADALIDQGAIALDRERRVGHLCMMTIHAEDSKGRDRKLHSYHFGFPEIVSKVLDDAGIGLAARAILLTFNAQPGDTIATRLSAVGASERYNPDRGGHAAFHAGLNDIAETAPILTIADAATIYAGLGRDYLPPEYPGNIIASLKGVVSERVMLHLLRAAAERRFTSHGGIKISNVEPSTAYEDIVEGFDGYFDTPRGDRRFNTKTSEYFTTLYIEKYGGSGVLFLRPPQATLYEDRMLPPLVKKEWLKHLLNEQIDGQLAPQLRQAKVA